MSKDSEGYYSGHFSESFVEDFLNRKTLSWELGSREKTLRTTKHEVTVHPFYRPDFSKTIPIDDRFLPQTTTQYYKAGENRTKHSIKLGAAVGEMIEALGGVNDA